MDRENMNIQNEEMDAKQKNAISGMNEVQSRIFLNGRADQVADKDEYIDEP